MDNVLFEKLARFVDLSAADKHILDSIVEGRRIVPPGRDIIADGDNPDRVHLILDGFACRYRIMPDGQRTITAYLIPGDICDLHVFLLNAMDHSVGTLSECRVAEISRASLAHISKNHPNVWTALLIASLVDQAVLREWLTNIGRRNAAKRIAHLLSELLVRLEVVGRVAGGAFDLPITQSDLADTAGLSSVHVNRSLKILRDEGLVTLHRNRLMIHDVEGLKAFAEFDPRYLHLLERIAGDRLRAAI